MPQKAHDVRQRKIDEMLYLVCVDCDVYLYKDFWMDDDTWEQERAEFLKDHPCLSIKDETA